MSMDLDIILGKIREVEKTASKSSVTRKGENAKKEVISSLQNLSRKIEKSSTDGLCLLVSKALSDFFTTLNVFLNDVNTKYDIDYEDFMDSLPEGDDQLIKRATFSCVCCPFPFFDFSTSTSTFTPVYFFLFQYVIISPRLKTVFGLLFPNIIIFTDFSLINLWH